MSRSNSPYQYDILSKFTNDMHALLIAKHSIELHIDFLITLGRALARRKSNIHFDSMAIEDRA